jgi:hypothetical protein
MDSYERPKKNQQRNFRVKLHLRPDGLNIHLQNVYPTITEYTFFSAAHGTL